MSTALVLIGVATWYGGIYVGQPLASGEGYYTLDREPWVALDSSALGDFYEWGDLLYLRFDNGTTMMARVWDCGPFSLYNVGGRPIVVDVPEHLAPFPGLSCGVEVWNISAMVREYARGYCEENYGGPVPCALGDVAPGSAGITQCLSADRTGF